MPGLPLVIFSRLRPGQYDAAGAACRSDPESATMEYPVGIRIQQFPECEDQPAFAGYAIQPATADRYNKEHRTY